jgi:beta-N-acetylhexosaminidase
VILFRDNVASPPQLRALTRSLQRAARGRALIMTDQEGDPVRRVPWAGPPPQRTLRTVAATRAAARAAGRTLRAAGVNVDLAPVADDARPGSALASRRYGGDPSRLTAAAVRGFRDARVLSTAKHFPGLGPARANTDFASATVTGLAARDLRPFKAAIAARVPLVMASHALYPALDRTRIASQSPAVLTGLLRGRLRFRGAVITDSLEAQAVVRRSSTPTAAARSLRAGADLLLTTGRGSYLPVLRRLIAESRRSAGFRARLREAAGRVRALRR